MNKNYRGYGNVMFKMKLLGFKEITTPRQKKNGTRIFRLPIKMYKEYIEVGSFKKGYVRRMNGGYTPYQLNKRIESEPQYFKSGKKDSMGRPLYTQFSTRTCKLIPNEVDRLEYLVDYCLKNYYIKQANQVEDGKFVPKWKHDDAYDNGYNHGYNNGSLEKKKIGWRYGNEDEISVIINGHRYNIT